jgi:hypothetical protein
MGSVLLRGKGCAATAYAQVHHIFSSTDVGVYLLDWRIGYTPRPKRRSLVGRIIVRYVAGIHLPCWLAIRTAHGRPWLTIGWSDRVSHLGWAKERVDD